MWQPGRSMCVVATTWVWLVVAISQEASATTGGPTALSPVCLDRRDRSLYFMQYRGDESGCGGSLMRQRGGQPVETLAGCDDEAVEKAVAGLPASCEKFEGPLELPALRYSLAVTKTGPTRANAGRGKTWAPADFVTFTTPYQLELRRGRTRLRSLQLDVCARESPSTVTAELYRLPGRNTGVALVRFLGDCSEGGYETARLVMLEGGTGLAKTAKAAPDGTSRLTVELPGAKLDPAPFFRRLAPQARKAGAHEAAASYLAHLAFNDASRVSREELLHMAEDFARAGDSEKALQSIGMLLSFADTAASMRKRVEQGAAGRALHADPRLARLLGEGTCCEYTEVASLAPHRRETTYRFAEGQRRHARTRDWENGLLVAHHTEDAPGWRARRHSRPWAEELNTDVLAAVDAGWDGTPVREEGPLVEGKREGLWHARAGDGRVAMETPFVDGAEQGTQRIFFPDGSTHVERTFQDGRRHGPEREWYPGGAKRCEAAWQDGEREGVRRCYFAGGKPAVEEHWHGGVLHGPRRYFQGDGRPTSIQLYARGERTFSCTFQLLPESVCAQELRSPEVGDEALRALGLEQAPPGAGGQPSWRLR